jgi:hypothetical protein
MVGMNATGSAAMSSQSPEQPSTRRPSHDAGEKTMKRIYMNAWDFLLRPFGKCVWYNPNCIFCVQIEDIPR